jgi:cytochrome P450
MPYLLPPGPRHPLYRYAHKPWVKLGHPIRLFEHLRETYGNISCYRFMGTVIVFVNDPEYIREILINQAPSFIKERTLKRMKILLGEGLITSDDPIHIRQRKIAAPFIASASPPTAARSSPAPLPWPATGTPGRPSTSVPP